MKEEISPLFCSKDLWAIYEAENPLAEILLRIALVVLQGKNGVRFGAWLGYREVL